jgi:hypothetical protein
VPVAGDGESRRAGRGAAGTEPAKARSTNRSAAPAAGRSAVLPVRLMRDSVASAAAGAGTHPDRSRRWAPPGAERLSD